ncbi:hypothetical protein INQ51_05835 [Maribellus sp. CM-23]|uniref:hypothetical protein n=1 Tax=Maribellus sp. CM-23 TaxID=2781026 RepID=UPI001F37CBA4|nr:hypothetical protein [Maribellus sp. CM-23]MCE4563824.1 hypothetical protein [Maribellus sp. CM-23]
MKRKSKYKQEEVKPKFKHFALAMVIIISVISPFFIIGDRQAKKWNEYLKENGKETIAFFVYSAGRMSSKTYEFQYIVNGKRYTASLNKAPDTPPNCPFSEIPMMVRYAEEKPARSITLPEKEFIYKGYTIKWITIDKSHNYAMTIEKNN